jgi:hypothetical protein
VLADYGPNRDSEPRELILIPLHKVQNLLHKVQSTQPLELIIREEHQLLNDSLLKRAEKDC